MKYACCAMVVNRTAGKIASGINFSEIEKNLGKSVEHVQQVVTETLRLRIE